jgi:hypothetical protein
MSDQILAHEVYQAKKFNFLDLEPLLYLSH